ncbi:MAG TPA: glycoside hydrolase family 3 N-terminal domain-containing protein, partial [Longimicrobiales bacterium]|nr:glycoside hydrolase family 3 N-terminal domain-containing protein [Longimicrobiales bacterium]
AQRRRWVEEDGIGGIYLSIGSPHTFAAVSNELQARARIPLLVTSDLEDGGPGMRLNHSYALPGLLPQGGGTAFPPTMAVGATGDERWAYEYGRVTAREARAVGVHLNFAPVLDVNSNPENPVIGTRSFGGDPWMVARMGAAYIRGLRAGGALSTGKHFPGHGDTRTDSHFDLPVVEADTAGLRARELIPFQAAVEAGVDAVMTAHVAIPGVLGPDAPPATLAPEILTGLLRDELGFTGLVVTDALEMAAIADRYGAGEAAVRALQAGTDILLNPRDATATVDAVVAAVGQGRLTEARIRESARRVLAMKARVGLNRERFVDLEAVDDVVGSGAHLAVADSIAGESLVLLRDPAAVVGSLPRVPLDLGDAATPPYRIVSLTLAEERDLAAGRTFDALLREAGHEVTSLRLGRDADHRDVAGLPGVAARADVMVVGLYLPTRVGTDRDALSPALRAVLRQVARTRPTLAVLLGSPYVVETVPEQASVLLAWGGREVSQRAAARAVLGDAAVTGTLPVRLPSGNATAAAPAPRLGEVDTPAAEPLPFSGEADPAAVGMSADTLARLDALLDSALADGAAPGAALAIGRHGRIVRLRGYGTLDGADTTRVTASTLYDVASMTKVVGTTSAVMILVDRGLLSLDDPVVRHLPWWSAGDPRKDRVTVRHLLTHTAGLPAFRRWFLEMEGREAYRDAIAAEALEAEPGTRTVYSDIGVMTLAILVEEIAGEPLDAFLDREVFDPLGMHDTGFNPDPAELGRIAPTEVDSLWRGGVHVRGMVHDENADAYGGVSGHAGLFSTARDLAVFAQFMLDRGVAGPCQPPTAAGAICPLSLEGPRRLIRSETVEGFTRRQDRRSSRALGWDTPGERSSAGDYFTERAFGHTGFTGTSIWIDPELDLFVVLLTNRVSPTRENSRHVPLRRAVHDLAVRAITDRRVPPRPGTPPAEARR